MKCDGRKKRRIGQEGAAVVEQIRRQRDWAFDLPLDGDRGAEQTGRQRFFECAEACRICRRQPPATPVKQFENRIELALLHLITVAFITRLNQVLDNTEALADDTLSF